MLVLALVGFIRIPESSGNTQVHLIPNSNNICIWCVMWQLPERAHVPPPCRGIPFRKLNIISTLAILLILLLQHVHNLHEVNTQDGIGDSRLVAGLDYLQPRHAQQYESRKKGNQPGRGGGSVDSGEWRDSIAAVEC